MKLVFILGLEHSGTTLTDYLLSLQPNVLGLGEIASFLSASHMRQYMQRWGSYSDVSLCSCGADWNECPFWGEIIQLSGLHSDQSLAQKYKHLFQHIRTTYGDNLVVVDSSKSLDTLAMLLQQHEQMGFNATDIHVIYTLKDVRSFTASIINKQGQAKSLLSIVRCFNYWLKVNRAMLDFVETHTGPVSINLYEHLCADPDAFVRAQMAPLLPANGAAADPLTMSGAHIAMGNKDFVMRNIDRVRYDSRWYLNDRIHLVYLLHAAARQFNHRVHKVARR